MSWDKLTAKEKERIRETLHPSRGPFRPETDSYKTEMAEYLTILAKLEIKK